MNYIKLGKIANVGSGQNAPQDQKEYCLDGYTFIKASNLDDIISDDNENRACKITDEAILNNKLKLIPKKSILFAKSGLSCIKNRVYLTKDESYVVNHLCILSNINDTYEPQWLAYFIKAFNVTKLIKDESYPSISLTDIKNINVPAISKKEQQIVTENLNTIKSAIRNKKNELSLLDELVKSRFVEMFSNYKAEKTINEIASICRGASPRPISSFITKDEGENWIKIGDVGENDVYITDTAEKVTKAGADKSRRVKPGDFILSNSMSFGRPYILGINGCVHDGWLIISNYEKTFEPLFFYYLLRSEDVQMQFDGSANGATVRNLNSDLVKKVVVMIPPMDKQKEFVDFAEQVDKSKFIVHSRYFLWEILTLFSSTIAYSRVVSILA